ncbi:MAG: biopolymer transporter ExbD [Planctomycetota bacterium]|nr:MAG: biopolymer transporter ExbD [Planctomycetota bacterium]REJ86780.1 MAG: biopolymer transporter ExbD [Planctomycetota bacterium]REK20477.1 MAG: biopolymer transporter ExbD [Planctomycetota bacterium]REK33859.1 MAG: biopolymer transporter ExbD [Planctomycetota bacterium]
MRLPTQYGTQNRRDQDAMTPMIDVVFQLLIFFVVASTGQVAEAFLPTELSAGGTVTAPVDPMEREPWADEVWVELIFDENEAKTLADLNGTLYEDLTVLTGVLRQLAEVSRESPVILDIGGDVPLGDVILVYDVCRAAGFDSVNFAADPSNGE